MQVVKGDVLNYCGYVKGLGGGMHRLYKLSNGAIIDCEYGLFDSYGLWRLEVDHGLKIITGGLIDITKKELLNLRKEAIFYEDEKLEAYKKEAATHE